MLANPFKYRTCEVTWQDQSAEIRSYRKDHITRALKRGHFYEDAFLEMIATQFAGPGMFVDVGSFVGNHAVFFAKHCGCDHVIGFEPFPETYGLLEHNIRRNGLESKITAVNKALSDEPGTLQMAIVNRRNRGMNRIDSEGTTSVAVSTLDTELATHEMPVRFIKIDAEGHGSKVLRGAKATIERHRPVIAIEVDPEPLEEISALLHESGFLPVSCHNGTPTWIFMHELTMQEKGIR